MKKFILKKLDILFLLLVLYWSGKCLIYENWNSPADDFASIYVAAQLMAEGNSSSIYDHHPYLFHVVPPGDFTETAEKVGFKGYLHPYVHLPLLSFICRPLLFLPYSLATRLLLLTNLIAVILSLSLIMNLMGNGFNLKYLSFILLAMAYFFPLRYSLWLGQTTPLIFLGITSVYYLARNGYQRTAGCILGGIISLKITPVFFLPYFLARRKWSLIFSSVITVTIVGICSVCFSGWESNIIFLQNIIRLIGFSLASWNNQSLDGFFLRWGVDAAHIYDWHLLELSFMMKTLKYFTLACMLLPWLIILFNPTRVNDDGLVKSQRSDDKVKSSRCKARKYEGMRRTCWYTAMTEDAAQRSRWTFCEVVNDDNQGLVTFSLTLVLLVILTPISWSHYLLFLVLPYMVLLITLVRNKDILCRTLMIGALIISYLCVALPPSYLNVLIPPSYLQLLRDVPFIHKVPFPMLSSLGFLGEVLLVVIFYVQFLGKRRIVPHG